MGEGWGQSLERDEAAVWKEGAALLDLPGGAAPSVQALRVTPSAQASTQSDAQRASTQSACRSSCSAPRLLALRKARAAASCPLQVCRTRRPLPPRFESRLLASRPIALRRRGGGVCTTSRMLYFPPMALHCAAFRLRIEADEGGEISPDGRETGEGSGIRRTRVATPGRTPHKGAQTSPLQQEVLAGLKRVFCPVDLHPRSSEYELSEAQQA